MDVCYEAAMNYLKRVEVLDMEIREMMERLDFLRASLTSGALTADSDRVQASPRDRVGDTCARIADLSAAVDRKVDRLADMRREMYDTIRRYVRDTAGRDILVRRYLYLHDLREIARKKRLPYSTVWRIHNKSVWQLSRKFSYLKEEKRGLT